MEPRTHAAYSTGRPITAFRWLITAAGLPNLLTKPRRRTSEGQVIDYNRLDIILFQERPKVIVSPPPERTSRWAGVSRYTSKSHVEQRLNRLWL